jgi:hypothetical protein
MAGFGYDNPGSYKDESPDFGALIPAYVDGKPHWAPMRVRGSEQKLNSSGWKGVRFEFEIVAGPHKSRRIWAQYTTHHATSEKAVKFGRDKIGSLLLAAGKVGAEDPSDIYGCTVDGRIGVEKGSPGYDDKNTVTGFRPFEPGATGDMAAAERAFADDDDLPF